MTTSMITIMTMPMMTRWKRRTAMIMPDGFYVIHQPKQKIPGLFDLHKRGRFKTRPFVTRDWDYRVIANTDQIVKLLYAYLVEEHTIDPETRIPYNFLVKGILMDLNASLALDTESLSELIPDKVIREAITTAHEEWRNAYVPMASGNLADPQALTKKIRASVVDNRATLCRQLASANQDWVTAALPRLIQYYTFGLEPSVKQQLHDHYRDLGGEADETQLLRKVALFYRVYENDGNNLLQKPDASLWKNEEEIWNCWAGFTGSETEAGRICDAMDAVFRPLVQQMAA